MTALTAEQQLRVLLVPVSQSTGLSTAAIIDVLREDLYNGWDAVHHTLPKCGVEKSHVLAIAELRSDRPTTREVEKTMKVTKKAGAKLLAQLGWANGDKYSASQVQKKLSQLDELADEKKQSKVKDGPSNILMRQILLSLTKGEAIEVVADLGDEEASSDAPPLTEKKAGKKIARPDPESNGEYKPAKKGAIKGVGVIATIAECLTSASERKPVTKAEVLDVLVKKFPDRPAASLKSTINHQIPSYLRKAGFDVQKSDKGYWAEGEKEKPAKKAAKAGKK